MVTISSHSSNRHHPRRMLPTDQRSLITFHLAILCQSNSWYARDLQRATRPDEQLHLTNYRDLTAELSSELSIHSSLHTDSRTSTRTAIDLCSMDAILVRSMPTGSLEQIVFRINALHALNARGTPVVNSARTLEIAIDKWLTLEILRRHGIDSPRTFACQTREQAMAGFRALGSDVVVKPLFGGEGRGLMRIQCEDHAWRVFGTLENCQSVLYLQEYLPHFDSDIRILVIGNEAFSVLRSNPNDWRSNLSRGGTATAYTPKSTELEIAMRVAEILGSKMVGVDLLPTQNGRLVVLEANAVPGWKGLAKCLNVDIARKVLDVTKCSPAAMSPPREV